MWQCAINVCRWPQSSCPGGSGGAQFSGLARAGLANRNEGLADRRRGLANRTEGLANRSEGLGGRAGLGPVDKSEGFGGLAGLGPVGKGGRMLWQMLKRGFVMSREKWLRI